TELGWRVTDSRVFDEQSERLQPRLVEEVKDAFQQYWDRLAEAYLHLSLTLLRELADDDPLATHRAAIRALADRNLAARDAWSFTATVLQARPTEALVHATVTLRRTEVDVRTYRDAGPPTAMTFPTTAYRLRKLDGRWKLVSEQALAEPRVDC